MSASFGLTVIVYAAGLAVLLGGWAITGRDRPPAVLAGLVFLELATLVQGGLDVGALAGSAQAETGVNVAYLLTSVVLLPVSAAAVRLDTGRWGSAAHAVGCALLAVVSVRLHQTLTPTSHG